MITIERIAGQTDGRSTEFRGAIDRYKTNDSKW